MENPNVPTWNYLAVHLYGKAKLIDDKKQVHQIVLDLSDINEKHREDPWIPDYDEHMLEAIVGFEIKVKKVEAKTKLSQNKTDGDRKGMIKALSASSYENDLAIAHLMKSL